MQRPPGGDLVLLAERFHAQPPPALFASVASAPSGAWLLKLHCDRVEPGVAIRFELPDFDRRPIEASGRFLEVIADRRIVVHQESPWRATIVVDLVPRDGGTLVRMRSTIAPDSLERLSSVPSQLPDDPGRPTVDLGVIVSMSGAAGLMGRAALNAAELAADELNATGGIHGVPVRIVAGDDRSSAVDARAEYRRLTRVEGVTSIVAMVPTPSFAAIAAASRRDRTLVVHTPLSEGAIDGPNVFSLGERPRDQLLHSIPAMMRATGARNWFVIGNDYCWPRTVSGVARASIEAAGGVVVGERFVGFGVRDFAPVVDAIRRAGTSLLLSALVGYDAVAFERTCHSAGLRAEVKTLSLLMDDTVREHIGAEAAEGVWVALDHFAGSAPPDGAQRAWNQRFGPICPPFGSTARSVYEGVHLVASAARLARSIDPCDVARRLRLGRPGNSRQLARVAGRVVPTAIGEASGDGFRLVSA